MSRALILSLIFTSPSDSEAGFSITTVKTPLPTTIPNKIFILKKLTRIPEKSSNQIE